MEDIGMEAGYRLEKAIWTEEDFDVMGWHDARVHGLAFRPERFEFALDIDYLFKWVPPRAAEKYFKLWVAPATIVFRDCWDITFDLGLSHGNLEIDYIKRHPHQSRIAGAKEWQWVLDCQQGTIELKASGFTQFIRATPQLRGGGSVPTPQREVSFSQETFI